MAYSGKTMTFAADLLPAESTTYSLGSTTKKWKIYADTISATDISITGSKSANYILAAPASSSGVPTFRALTAADIPAVTITDGTTGTLTVPRGGTGANSFTANSVIISGNSDTAALTTRTLTNVTANASITANTNIPTLNTIYYGLTKINDVDQSHANTIYAPTAAGTTGQVLKSAGSGAPGWADEYKVEILDLTTL